MIGTRKMTAYVPPASPIRCRRGLILFLGLFAALTVLDGCGSPGKADPNAAPVAPVVKVQRRDITSQLSIASEFQPFQEISVYAKVSGYIQKLYIDWGTHVKTGQLMAVLEIPELEQQIQQDQASVKKSEQDLARANEELTRSNSAYTVAHLTYSRLAGVQKTKPQLISQEEIDEAQGKDLEANANVSAAKDAVAASQEAMAGSKAALDKDRALFAYSRITAPFDGVVTQMNAYTGALLPAGTSSNQGDLALCHLSQNNLLRLVIPVPERVVSSIHNGEMVDVRVTGLDDTFKGKIVRFSDSVDLDTRTMHTEVDVANPKYEIVPGMYATVDLPVQTVQSVLTLPIQAVQVSGERGRVLLVDSDNKLESRTVKVGVQDANNVEIVSGLGENDSVVFGEQSQFKPDEVIKPQLVTPAESGVE